MAASSSSSSASSFGRLLQSARISTWDPTIPQLYTAPAAFAARGQYGFKRPIPVPQVSGQQQQGATSSAAASLPLSKISRQRNVDLVLPDTPAGISIWATDSAHPRFIRTFEEKAVKLLDYDPLQRREAQGKGRRPAATEPSTVFDPSTRRLLPTEVHEQDAVRLAQGGLARQDGSSAKRSSFVPSYTYSGIPLHQSESPGRSQYTSLDIVPDYARMTDKQFEAYLEKVRTEVRPALIRHLTGADRARASATIAAAKAAVRAREAEDRKLAEQAQDAKASGVEVETADAHAEIAAGREPGTIPVGPQQSTGAEAESQDSVIVDMWDASRTLSSSYTTTFVRCKLANEAVQPKSTTLPDSSDSLVPIGDLPALHSNGGLQYGTPDEIYTSRLSRPPGLPAHILHRVEDFVKPSPTQRPGRRAIFSSSPSGRGGAAVSLGGHVAHIPGIAMPRHLTNLESVYEATETSASDATGPDSSVDQQTHVLVRPINAYQSELSSADRARQSGQYVPSPPSGISPTASLAASAAGRPVGSAREHVVLPDLTSIHVRVRPVYMDEVFVKEAGPLSIDPELSTPGSRAHVGAQPKPLSVSSGHPGVVPISSWAQRGLGEGGIMGLGPRRVSPAMAAESMRMRENASVVAAAAQQAGAQMKSQLSSIFSEVSNVGASVSRADGSAAAAAGASTGAGGVEVPRLKRTSVGPAARRKHQSNVKK
ncbi:hypothetical protein OC835_002867 [Tilletia horrida]|nr:hypothetical protein OC835_002867 [Tilletia horrida]KAK0560364.1 hypothetical protein OC844_003809 [Tilletia horrida]